MTAVSQLSMGPQVQLGFGLGFGLATEAHTFASYLNYLNISILSHSLPV